MDCYFLISDNPGGAEQVLMQLAKTSHSVVICIFKSQKTNLWQTNGFEPHYCNSSFRKLAFFLKHKRFERVYSSHLMINASLGILRQKGILKTEKLICRESTSVFSRYNGLKLLQYKMAYWLGYKNMDLVITQSEEMKIELIKHMPFLSKRTRIETIPNPFVFPTSLIDSKNLDYPYLVSAGRLIPEKGFDILIDAFSIIKQKNKVLKLVILGGGQEKAMLTQKINSLNLQDDVILQGFTNDVYPWFKGAEACVVSSRIEGFPNVLLQMMSQNDKVVSTLCAGGIEKIAGITTAETNNVVSLHKAIIESLDSDSSKNRLLFNKELESRSVDKFLNKMDIFLW